MQQTITAAKALVKQKMGNDTSGHDFYHVERVVKLAVFIAEAEGEPALAQVELLAWLHDMADVKLVANVAEEQVMLQAWLQQRLPTHEVSFLMTCLAEIGFKGGDMKATHAISKIVNDADKLDAMGAVGIARCFAYGGNKQQAMYNPKMQPLRFENEAAYRQLSSTSYNHIFEKLLTLKDFLYTNTAQELAKPRHEFLMQYVEQFEREVGCIDNAQFKKSKPRLRSVQEVKGNSNLKM